MCYAHEMIFNHEMAGFARHEMIPSVSLNEICLKNYMSRNPCGLRLISRLQSKHFIHWVNFICRKANFIVNNSRGELFTSLFDSNRNSNGHTNHGVVTCCYGFHLSSLGVIYRHLCRPIFCFLPNGETLRMTQVHLLSLGIICADVGKMSACRQIYPL